MSRAVCETAQRPFSYRAMQLFGAVLTACVATTLAACGGDSPRVVVDEGTVGGVNWRLVSYERDGDRCLDLDSGRVGGGGCGGTPTADDETGVFFSEHGRASFAFGEVGARIASVRVHFGDLPPRTVRVKDGRGEIGRFFVAAVRGMRKVRKVEGLDKRGRVIDSYVPRRPS